MSSTLNSILKDYVDCVSVYITSCIGKIFYVQLLKYQIGQIRFISHELYVPPCARRYSCQVGCPLSPFYPWFYSSV